MAMPWTFQLPLQTSTSTVRRLLEKTARFPSSAVAHVHHTTSIHWHLCPSGHPNPRCAEAQRHADLVTSSTCFQMVPWTDRGTGFVVSRNLNSRYQESSREEAIWKDADKNGNLRCKVGDLRRDCKLVCAGELSESHRADAYEQAVAKLKAGLVSQIWTLGQRVPCWVRTSGFR